MKKYLISYGDDRYRNRRMYFKESAKRSGFFDDVLMFSPSDFDDEFYNQIYRPVQHLRGGGFWLWKPYLIKIVLDRIEEGDILIYCDSGCTINPNALSRFNEYIDLLKQPDINSIAFQLEFKEYQYTKHEVFNYFNSAEDIVNAKQLMATVILLKKCEHTSMLVDIWYHTAIYKPLLFTDEWQVHQREEFIDHRHDQSIFSVIRNNYGSHITADETYFPDFMKDGMTYPFWTTRFRG